MLPACTLCVSLCMHVHALNARLYVHLCSVRGPLCAPAPSAPASVCAYGLCVCACLPVCSVREPLCACTVCVCVCVRLQTLCVRACVRLCSVRGPLCAPVPSVCASVCACGLCVCLCSVRRPLCAPAPSVCASVCACGLCVCALVCASVLCIRLRVRTRALCLRPCTRVLRTSASACACVLCVCACVRLLLWTCVVLWLKVCHLPCHTPPPGSRIVPSAPSRACAAGNKVCTAPGQPRTTPCRLCSRERSRYSSVGASTWLVHLVLRVVPGAWN